MPVQKMCYLGCQIVVRHLGWLQNPTLLTNTEQTEPRNATSFHFLLHYVYIILFLEKITVKIKMAKKKKKNNMKVLTAQKLNKKQSGKCSNKKGKENKDTLALSQTS